MGRVPKAPAFRLRTRMGTQLLCTVANANIYNAPTLQAASGYPNAASMYRTIFAGNPTKPALIMLEGSFREVSDLMQSAADGISSMTGRSWRHRMRRMEERSRQKFASFTSLTAMRFDCSVVLKLEFSDDSLNGLDWPAPTRCDNASKYVIAENAELGCLIELSPSEHLNEKARFRGPFREFCRRKPASNKTGGEWGIRTPDRTFGPITV